MSRLMRFVALAGAVFVAAPGVVACGSGDSTGDQPTETTATSTVSTTCDSTPDTQREQDRDTVRDATCDSTPDTLRDQDRDQSGR